MPAFPTKFRSPIVEGVPKGPQHGTATLDFGTGEYRATVTVTGQTWVNHRSVVLASVGSTETADHMIDDVSLEGITCYVGRYVIGVGFTIYANAPLGTFGDFTVNWFGE